MSKYRFIAYYLPQFHPIPENDLHWGKGFTEWTNVKKARPLFRGHYQPFVPTRLGYYDLRDSAARKAQAELAKQYGIEGFCYWHYWFGNGKRLLELPFNEVVSSGEPDFPFCLCWANHSWTAIWVGDTKTVILEQSYPGIQDYTNHFYTLLPAFKDQRYIRVDGKLLFSVFHPKGIPDPLLFTKTWRSLAAQEGVGDFHFVGMGITDADIDAIGFDACTAHTPHDLVNKLPMRLKDRFAYKLYGKSFSEWRAAFLKTPRVIQYSDMVRAAKKKQFSAREYPVALPNWDHSPRSGKRAFVLQNATPALFGTILKQYTVAILTRPHNRRIVFIKAWNEWAEGNFLEPEKKYGTGYLEEIYKIGNADV